MGSGGGLEVVLAQHGPSGTVNSREGWVGCECGDRLHLPSGLTFDGYAEMWDEERKARDAHVAAELVAHLEAVAGEARAAVAEAIETEFANGNMREDAADRILAALDGVRDDGRGGGL